MPATIALEHSQDSFVELSSLHGWLAGGESLRGRVTIERPDGDGTTMGWLADVVTVAVGNGGAVTALAGSLATWLVSRRSHVKIKVTGPDGRCVEVDVRQARGDQAAVEAMLRKVLDEPGANRS
jgi:hypothetical protein